MRQSNEKLQAQDLFTQNAATISSDVLASLGNPFASTSGVICQSRKSPIRQDQAFKGPASSQSPTSKRQSSAPKIRKNNHRDKRENNQQTQYNSSSQLRSKKRGGGQQHGSSKFQSNVMRSQNNNVQAMNIGQQPLTGSSKHNVEQKNINDRFSGQQPLILSHNINSVSSVQTHENRGRSKDPHSNRVMSHSTARQKISNQSKMVASVPNSQSIRVSSEQPTKSLAAIAIGLRQNQCQTALLQHKNATAAGAQQQMQRRMEVSEQIHHQQSQLQGGKMRQQNTMPQNGAAYSPRSKRGSKESLQFNKTISTRQVEREQALAMPNTLTHSTTRHTLQVAQGPKSSKRSRSKEQNTNLPNKSRRNELENYLSKILSQQQKLYLNTYDPSQMHALYSQTGIADSTTNNNKLRSSKKSAQHTSCSANITVSQNKPKRLNGVVLLSDHLQKNRWNETATSVAKQHQMPSNGLEQIYQLTQRQQQIRNLQSNNNGKRDSQSSEFKERRKKQQNVQQRQNQRSLASLQYMSSGRKGGKSQSSSNVANIGGQQSSGAQSNSLLLMRQQQLLNLGSAGNARIKGSNRSQVRALKNQMKGANAIEMQNQNYMFSGEIKKAIRNRMEVLDNFQLGKGAVLHPQSIPINKSISARQLISSKSPCDELISIKGNNSEVKTPSKLGISTSHNTIVNIRANNSQMGLNISHGDDNDANIDLDMKSKAKSRSTHVEYHSDSDLERLKTQVAGINSRQALIDTKETFEKYTQVSPRLSGIDLISSIERVEAYVQTSEHVPDSTLKKDSEMSRSISHHEDNIHHDKIQFKGGAPYSQDKHSFEEHEMQTSKQQIEHESDIAELAIWALEKQAIETYSVFYTEQFEPFVRDVLTNIQHDPQSLVTVNQLLDIFGVRHEQMISKEERQICASADLFYRMSSQQIIALQRLSKLAHQQIQASQKELRIVTLEKDDQITALKEQVRKLQKELFIRSEKLHLSEQMNKLKEKEVTNVRNKINTLTEGAERSVKEHQRAIQRREQEQERNFAKAARELKTLYEQNKELFQHNKALRDDLQDQDEKVRKLVNVIQRHPSLLQDIENELDRTESKLHDQSQISDAIPYGIKRDNRASSDAHAAVSPDHGVIFVGQNKVAIPKFDPDIIEKYTKLNIEGKLPHIVETNKFNPEKAKQEVKDVFREIKNQQYDFDDQPLNKKNAHQKAVFYPNHSNSGIGNDTPFSNIKEQARNNINFVDSHIAAEKDFLVFSLDSLERDQDQLDLVAKIKDDICDQVSDHRLNLYQESSNDMSGGGERKQRKSTTMKNAYTSINSPNVLAEHHRKPVVTDYNDQPPQMTLAQTQSHTYLPQVFQLQGLPTGQQVPVTQFQVETQATGMNTPVNKQRKVNDGVPSQGAKKDLNTQFAIAHAKQHQVQTIVTLQNQLYHQLMTQTQNMPGSSATTVNERGSYSNPTNLQTPISPLLPDSSPNQPNILSSTQNKVTANANGKNIISPQSADSISQMLLPTSTDQVPASKAQPSTTNYHQQKNPNTLHQRQFSEEQQLEGTVPDFQSVDLPMLQTPSQTVTLALELTDNLNQQILQHSSDIGATTNTFNQILINDPTQVGNALLQQRPLQQQQIYQRRGSQASTIEADYSDQHPNMRSSGMAGLIHHLQHQGHGVMYNDEEDEEKCGAYSCTEYSNKQGMMLMTGSGEPADETTQQMRKNEMKESQAGPTLQDQISKQYSPILRRHESLEHINDFSPSLINDRNELSNAAEGQKYNLMRIQATASLITPNVRQANYSLGERNGFCGLTSIDQEKSVSLLDSIAVKEEDSTQKKYIEPQASSSSAEHGGNEQFSNSNQIIIEHQPQQQFAGEAPLDISRVDDNFDSSQNQGNDQSGQDSADFLEDQNFQQVAPRRSSYDGHYYMSSEQII